jgi:hypothetical protein
MRLNGIAVELDQFHQDEIIDWPQWCNRQISEMLSDYVICVCTQDYLNLIEGRVPPAKGKGVYWEGTLLDDEIYNAKGNRRILPIVLDNESETSIPRFLRGWTFCRVCEFTILDHGYEHLLRIITGQVRVTPNSLGDLPEFPSHSVMRRIDSSQSGTSHFLDKEDHRSEMAKRKRRLDAAVPASIPRKANLDLLVQVRFADSKLLGFKDCPSISKPKMETYAKVIFYLMFARHHRTGELAPSKIKIQIVTVDFDIAGASRRILEVPPN